MAIDVEMPALSPTMEKGTLAKWLVAVGDEVKSGDVIAEIETDKATMELEAVDEGRIASLLVAEGTDDVPVGTAIATMAEQGEDIVAAPAPETRQPAAAEALVETQRSAAPAAPEPAPAPVADPIPATDGRADGKAYNATPLARRIASMKGLALGSLKGSGSRGKIVKADLGLPSLLSPPQTAAAQITEPRPPLVYDPPAGVPVESVKLSTMRKTIARRLGESKRTVPHFYLTVRCNLDPLLTLRRELNASLAARGVKLSVNDFMIKALAGALAEVPDANVQFGGDMLHRFSRSDIAMAVAIEGGLVTPVIRDAASLSLSAIAEQSQALAAKAREGKLGPGDYEGGTASISNLGMFGIDEMFPVINPPQALILGIGAGIEQPWKVDGELALATIMSATASFDHRAIDGAVAARFMAAFKLLVESPLLIMG
ncbi:dihydrolipoamide acetyltransferase family protein [uncultured Parasphingorhabdus sp.]|uniref:dihydrolipoamide acetyltransferase family protein n=1 Tax=uncultured Parasphingorhabdus sp. TaxID=2709694 RepID=UPI002AA6F10B|nr:dihydrolipoamide acetyltransferase family protein [uncultured Parasphingorhabdus sp.]